MRPEPGSIPMILPSNVSAFPLRSAIESVYRYVAAMSSPQGIQPILMVFPSPGREASVVVVSAVPPSSTASVVVVSSSAPHATAKSMRPNTRALTRSNAIPRRPLIDSESVMLLLPPLCSITCPPGSSFGLIHRPLTESGRYAVEENSQDHDRKPPFKAQTYLEPGYPADHDGA